jgi:hypothetical protein
MTMARVVALLAILVIMAGTRAAVADIYLVGAQEYQADSSGAGVNGVLQFSTNSNTAPFPVTISNGGPGQSSAISFQLVDGLNIFTASSFVGTNFATMGLNLFFNITGTSHNPTSNAQLSPDSLTVYGLSGNAGSMATPVLGTSILSYASSSMTLTTPANGLSSLSLDGKLISISSYSFGSSGPATFQINVSAVPEAGSLALVSVAVVAAAGWRLRRKFAE